MTALCMDRIIGPGALAALPEAVARHGLGRQLMLVCDDATYVAAGQQVYTSLLGKVDILPHSLGRRPVATLAAAQTAIARASQISGIVAVGSGTVNDVAKYTAHQRGIPYLCVATAASMNGYSSATASLDDEGMKQSFEATPPRAVLADMDIIAAAPKRLTRAGVGDTLCRTTVEADCLLSHHLLGTPYPQADFALMRRHEAVLIQRISELKENSHAYIGVLMEALLDGGDAMARAGSSITASQGEHMIAHTLEILYGHEMDVLHGEMIAVTTLTMNELQNKMLLSAPAVKRLPRDEAYCTRTFGRKMGAHVAAKYAPKVLSPEQVEVINASLARTWPELKQRLAEIILPTSTLSRAYIHGNIPSRASDIRMHETRYDGAVTNAYLTRNRFTFLDVAAMMYRRLQVD